MVEAYPLHWPGEYPRSKNQIDSRFTTTLGKARDYVKDEIRRMGGTPPVISTNIPLKNDGDLRANWASFRIDDTGVAVYFLYKGNQVCLCCDQYKKIWDNLHAIGRTIAALRQIDRDGVSDFLNRAFTGFKALPESPVGLKTCWEVLGIIPGPRINKETINDHYKILAKKYHPDVDGGSNAAFALLNLAKERAMLIVDGEANNEFIQL